MPDEKVIYLDEVKLYRATAEVLYLGAPDECLPEVVNPTPVISEDRRLLGWASLFIEGNRVKADLALDYATPERLDIEAGLALYAWADFGPKGVAIHAVKLLRRESYGDQPPIGEVLL
jgi:hypothetical protein